MKTHFYDIESLSNVFSNCIFKPDENMADVYLLCDEPHLTSHPDFEKLLLQRIHEKNKNFNGGIRLLDLHEQACAEHFAMEFGLSDAYLINDPDSESTYGKQFRLVCDTDVGYDPDIHPYLLGYNSYNYDTTMLALFLYDAFYLVPAMGPNGFPIQTPTFKPPTAKQLRSYNDDLFRKQFKENMPVYLARARTPDGVGFEDANYQDRRWKIRKNMLMTGRHLDVARLNEKQSKVGLKRLLGMLGLQILESEKLSQNQDTIHNMDELLDLLAYNISDVVNLDKLFQHKVYKGQFQLKSRLLKTYPELIYDRVRPRGGKPEYRPDINPKSVRRDRLFIDSSSAQLTTKALCPYDHLSDIPVVDFLYPDPRKAKELGIPVVDVLEETKKFFYDNFPQPELRKEFDRIYNFYASIRGKNFNESANYRQDYPDSKGALNLKRHPKTDLNLFYYHKDGTPSTCFVTFSTGGIHGAEYNKARFDADMANYQQTVAIQEAVMRLYPNPVDLKVAKKVLVNGQEYTAGRFLAAGSTTKQASYKNLDKNRPVLFKLSEDGSTKLNPKYVYTSSDETNHEDFTSYYPNLLRMMMAFYNAGLGYDRYAEIFDNKQNYGFLMKSKTPMTPEQASMYRALREATGLPLDEFNVSQEERDLYDILRDGTKLMLNSASGAADANFESTIRMNNQIIKMRIIGQLFSYRIGQAQTLGGAKITSTNTDGLYSVLESSLNNILLEREAKNIGVEIEPEPTYLISKDTNNRIEMNPDTGKIQSASGGTLACRQGPNPTKALAHPAIIDWALTEYLIVAAVNEKGGYGNKYQGRSIGLDLDFDDALGESILKSATKAFPDRVKFLTMFQNIVASAPGSITYIFATKPGVPDKPIPMQHYNRVFIMKDDTADCVHLHAAAARKITPATLTKRKRDPNARMQQNDPLAMDVLLAQGVGYQDIPQDCEAIIKKVTNIEDNWYMFIQNADLNYLSDKEFNFIVDNLDYEKYLMLLRDAFENSWRNHIPDIHAANIVIGPFVAAIVPPKAAKTKKSRKDPALTAADITIQNGIATAKTIVAGQTANTNSDPQPDPDDSQLPFGLPADANVQNDNITDTTNTMRVQVLVPGQEPDADQKDEIPPATITAGTAPDADTATASLSVPDDDAKQPDDDAKQPDNTTSACASPGFLQSDVCDQLRNMLNDCMQTATRLTMKDDKGRTYQFGDKIHRLIEMALDLL